MINNSLTPIHPGEYLSEMLEELNISQASFARTIDVSPMRISHIIKCKPPVTAELALLFAKAFEQTPQYWLNLQTSYDLKTTEKTIASRLFSIHSLTHAF
jgi:antitoxin HigA-1